MSRSRWTTAWCCAPTCDYAACIEGAGDFYRDVSRHGGILHTFDVVAMDPGERGEWTVVRV